MTLQEKIIAIYKKLNVKVEMRSPELVFGSKPGAAYDAGNDTIIFEVGLDLMHDMDVVSLHELIHWTGERNRCARDRIVKLSSKNWQRYCNDKKGFAEEEYIAQTGMYILALELGMRNRDARRHLVDYLKLIHSRTGVAFKRPKIEKQAREAVSFILSAIQERKAA